MSKRLTDIKVANNVVVAYATYYNKKNYNRLKYMLQLLEKAMPILSTELSLPQDMTIRICNIRSKNTGGQYFGYCKLLELNVDCSDPLLFLCHELVHAEQYHTGKLTQGGMWFSEQRWQGKIYEQPKNYSFNQYMNFPWEKEAYARETDLKKLVLRRMLSKRKTK